MQPSDNVQPQRGHLNCFLPAFWSDDAAGWFTHVEFRIQAKRIYDEWDHFDLVVQVLPQTVFRIRISLNADPEQGFYLN